MPVHHWGFWVAVLTAVVAAGYGLDRLALWMEARGWIYWRRKKPAGGGGAMAGLLSGFQQFVEPQAQQAIVVKDARRLGVSEQDQQRNDKDRDGSYTPAA